MPEVFSDEEREAIEEILSDLPGENIQSLEGLDRMGRIVMTQSIAITHSNYLLAAILLQLRKMERTDA